MKFTAEVEVPVDFVEQSTIFKLTFMHGGDRCIYPLLG